MKYRKFRGEFYHLYDALTLSAADYVSRWFESDVVKATFIYWASIGCTTGPRSPGTAINIVSHLVGENGMGFSRGGMGTISEAIAASGKSYGMEVRTEAPVAEIIITEGRATGVRLADGEEIRGGLVVSNLAAPVTFGRLVAAEHLPKEFLRRIASYKCKGTAFKINMAVETPPHYRGFNAREAGVPYPAYAHIGPSVDYFERAYDDAKYGWYSSRPYISPIVPSMIDGTLAPEGKHVVTLYGGHASYELKDGVSWDDEQDKFVRNVMEVMDEFAPGFSSSIIAMNVYLARDLERILGMPGGHEAHGEVSLDQLFFMRPVPGYADYRTPIAALYQCGASTHPGGAVSAVPGHNAAREILRDRRRWR